jgi:hypothetical protein
MSHNHICEQYLIGIGDICLKRKSRQIAQPSAHREA